MPPYLLFCKMTYKCDSGKDKWHEAYDCELGCEVLFRIIPRVLPADNSQASETCSHIGLKGNFFCCQCKVGGTNLEKESDEGYQALFDIHKSLLLFKVSIQMFYLDWSTTNSSRYSSHYSSPVTNSLPWSEKASQRASCSIRSQG